MNKRLLISILCALLACFIVTPVSAATLSAGRTASITSIDYSGPSGSSISAVSYPSGSANFQLFATSNSNSRMFLNLRHDTIPANSIIYLTLSVSGASTAWSPLCFTGGYNHTVLSCDINGDNQNYTVSAVLYATASRSNTVLYNYVLNNNLTYGNQYPYISISQLYYASVDKELSESDITYIKDKLNKLDQNTDGLESRLDKLDQNTDGIEFRLENIMNYVIDIQSGKLDSIIDQFEEQKEQDQQDREDLTDQKSAADTSAADSGDEAEEAGTSLLSAVSSFVGVLTNASPSDCVIDMDLGNLDMGNVDLCQLSPPQPIPTIASIMLISFFVPLSWATATRMIGLFRSFTG